MHSSIPSHWLWHWTPVHFNIPWGLKRSERITRCLVLNSCWFTESQGQLQLFTLKSQDTKKNPVSIWEIACVDFWLQILSRWTQALLTPHKGKQRSLSTSAPPNTAFPVFSDSTAAWDDSISISFCYFEQWTNKKHGNHHTTSYGLFSMEGRFETNPFSNCSYLPTCDLLPKLSPYSSKNDPQSQFIYLYFWQKMCTQTLHHLQCTLPGPLLK